jgi:hypothetical protein
MQCSSKLYWVPMRSIGFRTRQESETHSPIAHSRPNLQKPALESTMLHLGCNQRWNRRLQQLQNLRAVTSRIWLLFRHTPINIWKRSTRYTSSLSLLVYLLQDYWSILVSLIFVHACGISRSTCPRIQDWEVVFSVLQEDEPTCSTPRRRPIEVSTQSSINALCTPPLDVLLNDFRARDAAGGPDRLSKVFPSIEASFRDSRTPLIAIN